MSAVPRSLPRGDAHASCIARSPPPSPCSRLPPSPRSPSPRPPMEGSPVVVDPVLRPLHLPGGIVRQDLAPQPAASSARARSSASTRGCSARSGAAAERSSSTPTPTTTALSPWSSSRACAHRDARLVEAAGAITFRVSGRVLVYKNRNFLLPTFYTVAVAGARHRRPGVDERTDDPALEDFGDLFAEPDADRRSTRPSRPSSGSTPREVEVPRGRTPREESASDAASARLVRGVQITARRTARRAPAGWMMTFDNDTDSAHADGATLDTPMEVLPCLSLQGMETLAEQYGQRLRSPSPAPSTSTTGETTCSRRCTSSRSTAPAT